MILLSLPLLVNFVGRLQAEVRTADAVQLRAERIKKSEIMLAQLREALEYAKSDAFTERYAREQARYAKPGEVVVVLSGAQDPASPHKAWWEDFVTLPQDGDLIANGNGDQSTRDTPAANDVQATSVSP